MIWIQMIVILRSIIDILCYAECLIIMIMIVLIVYNIDNDNCYACHDDSIILVISKASIIWGESGMCIDTSHDTIKSSLSYLKS
jgi:hypothetical protein